MTALVLDASVALAWHFRDEATDRTRAISALTDEMDVVVPSHWFLEIANGLLMGERRGRTSSDESVRFAQRTWLLNVEVDAASPEAITERILPLARAHRLTIYDTLYLELAGRRGLPLASLDGELNRAARDIGIAILAKEA